MLPVTALTFCVAAMPPASSAIGPWASTARPMVMAESITCASSATPYMPPSVCAKRIVSATATTGKMQER